MVIEWWGCCDAGCYCDGEQFYGGGLCLITGGVINVLGVLVGFSTT